jgi:cytochrome c-type biogenesis protein
MDSFALLVPAAFLAGLLSFLSPCTLPILPAYFAYTFGTQGESRGSTGRVALTSVAFFLGLATTLSLLGASATALGRLLFEHLDRVTVIGGLIVIVFGVMTLFGKGFSGLRLANRPAASVGGSYLYGATFAIGWSTCIGPILGTLLTLLASGGLAAAQGAALAFVYALGLGVPMIAIALFFNRLGSGTAFWRFARGRGIELPLPTGQTLYLHSTGVLSGVLMVGLGIMIASGQLTAITQAAASSDLSLWVIDAEERLKGIFGLQ